jgi:hypothetical protein
MFLISHRGNINGPNQKQENHPDYIMKAIDAGYDVEVDVWFVNGKFFLGHDFADHEVSKYFLLNDKIWCHAKNIIALHKLVEIGAHCFWHENDKCTLTSKGYIWTYPGEQLFGKSIAVMPKNNKSLSSCIGVCCDYISQYGETNE